MAKFKDKKGREWTLEFDVGLLEVIKRETGIEFDSFTESPESQEKFATMLLGGHGRKLVEVLWVLCEEQATAIDVKPEDFGRLFTGPVLEAAQVALLEALADFSPRQVMGRVMKSHLPKILTKMDAAIEAGMNREITQMLERSG